LLKAFATAQSDPDLHVLAPSHVTHAVYPERKGRRKLYILNTDTDLDAVVTLSARGRERKLLLPPTECASLTV
jgi:hypothetical protein